MGICDWDQEDIDRLDEGLKLLGWRSDGRLTSDDGLMLSAIAEEAISLKSNGLLSPTEIDKLAIKAFDIIEFQLMNVDERSMQVSSAYSDSEHLRSLVPLIEQTLFCYYRGYFTASLAVLFIVLENYLRSLNGWEPGDRDPTFAELRNAILNLSESESRDDAQRIINIVYSRYDAGNPPQFYFNRHGLLHGLREGFSIDRLNCVRMYVLLDALSAAEGYGGGGIITSLFNSRREAYLKCKNYERERSLLYPNIELNKANSADANRAAD